MRLSPETLRPAVAELAMRDPDLATVVERFGPPPLWAQSHEGVDMDEGCAAPAFAIPCCCLP